MIKQTRKMLSSIYHLPRKIEQKRLNQKAEVCENPIFVLGNQKSGTSAIAALLAELTGLPASIDLRGIREPVQSKLHNKKISFPQFVEANKYDFSKKIIKEPSLTFLYDDLVSYFPQAKSIFIVRDPRDNFRSILNRVDLPGDLESLDTRRQKTLHQFSKDWERVIDGRWLGIKGEQYVEWMAGRWNLAVDIYNQHANDMELVRYEDFVKDKAGAIEDLAQRFHLPKVNEIGDKVDIQYQPAGNKNVDKVDFFGRENLERIERICGVGMKQFGYTSMF